MSPDRPILHQSKHPCCRFLHSCPQVIDNAGIPQRSTSFLHLSISSTESQSQLPRSMPSVVASGAQQLVGSSVPAPHYDARGLVRAESSTPTRAWAISQEQSPLSILPSSAQDQVCSQNRCSNCYLWSQISVAVEVSCADPHHLCRPSNSSRYQLTWPPPLMWALGPSKTQMPWFPPPVQALSLSRCQLPRLLSWLPHYNSSCQDLTPAAWICSFSILEIIHPFPPSSHSKVATTSLLVGSLRTAHIPSSSLPTIPMGPSGDATSPLVHPGFQVAANPTHGVGTPSSPSPRVQLLIFKGASEWKVFWLQFRRTTQQYSWNTETTFHHLVASLWDDVLQFYAELPEAMQADLSLTIGALARRFNYHGLSETYRAFLMTLRKQSKGTLEEYASHVHWTVSKAYPSIAKLVDWICLPTTHVLQDILAVLHK